MRINLSSSVATAGFSKFADILSVALRWHHLLRFLNSSAGTPLPPLALLTTVLPKAHLTLLSECLALGE